LEKRELFRNVRRGCQAGILLKSTLREKEGKKGVVLRGTKAERPSAGV